MTKYRLLMPISSLSFKTFREYEIQKRRLFFWVKVGRFKVDCKTIDEAGAVEANAEATRIFDHYTDGGFVIAAKEIA